MISTTIELSVLLGKNVSMYDWNFDFNDCLYEMWKEDFYENIKENWVWCYIMKDDKKVYLDDEMIKHVDYDYDVDFDNMKIEFAEMIWDAIDRAWINLEEIFWKYWIMYVWNDFYTPHYYNFDNDSYDIAIALKDDEDTYWQDFLQKYWLEELVQYYIDNIRVSSYDWYMSYEPSILEDVVRNDYCTIYAILKKENVFEDLQQVFEDLIINCDALYIREENIIERRYTLDEYVYEDWNTWYERSINIKTRNTYEVLFE